MSDQLLIRLLIAASLVLVGTAFLAHGIWARRGRSERARAWMGNEFGGFQGEERWAVLGGPSIGVLCLCCAAMMLPRIGLLLALVAAPGAVLAFALMFLSRMYFIPLPDVIYPRWARPLRERNRRVEEAWKQEFRRRRKER
ncbi:hypothetical protein [Brachybacterium paraconglomeratum]|uniref:hypothetical protein n=1 Tax=Brachybacterium paraconglomeratum TaxID=173362 RepID=UPI003FD4B83D